jgi:hypothetical protein
MDSPAEVLQWSAWSPLLGASRDSMIPHAPGLYRIRRIGREDLDYIGQTGRSLRGRLGMLMGIYAQVMPYADPHTAGPALWALRHATGCEFEASVVPVEGSTPWRKGVEALAIALYRQEHGRSPTVEFGRTPQGYRASSSYNRRLLEAGRVYRGGACEGIESSHAPGVPPVGPLTGDPQGPEWGGHAWSPWVLLSEMRKHPPGGSGLYRIRAQNSGGLLYVGQGGVANRLIAHAGKIRTPGHAQGEIFAAAAPIECSWAVNDAWLAHQRLELENDLIAAHLLTTGQVPAAQFLG